MINQQEISPKQQAEMFVQTYKKDFNDQALIRAIQLNGYFRSIGCFKEVIDHLLTDKKACTGVTEDGSSALLWAVKTQNADLVQKIVKSLPQLLNKPNNDGLTPYLLAARNRDIPVLRVLHAAGVKTKVKTKEGLTASDLANLNILAVQKLPRSRE